MAKKFYTTAPGINIGFTYQSSQKEGRYEIPVSKHVMIDATHISRIEVDPKQQIVKQLRDDNPRSDDRIKMKESSPTWEVPITPDTLRWEKIPPHDCPDIIAAFLMSIKCLDRSTQGPVSHKKRYLTLMAGEPSNLIIWEEVPEGTPDSFSDNIKLPLEVLETKEMKTFATDLAKKPLTEDVLEEIKKQAVEDFLASQKKSKKKEKVNA